MKNERMKIKELVKAMLIESHKKEMENIDRLFSSETIDIDSWDKNILPKIMLTAILENEAKQCKAPVTRVEKYIKKRC
jgi:selenophosphate synthetase-related protein